MLTSAPGLGRVARRFGVITAGPEAARQAFDQGASLLVYPGGDVEVMRPWTKRFEIDFDNRKGFLRLAYENNVPIVPVVTDGMHDSLILLTDGRKLARMLRLDKLGRIKVLPIAISAPFGISIGDLFHVPFPVKVRTEVLPPIDLNARYGDDIDYDHAYDYVTSTMQVGLKKLATKRTLPI
jgi:1-acyl-sn-glycerol-3-phosphate acyltransferase